MAQETKAEGAGKKLGNNAQPNEPARFKADILPSERPALILQEQAILNDALITAAKDGNNAEVIYLIKEGADIAAANHFDLTPLQRAAWQGHTQSCRILIKEYRKAGGDVKELIKAKNGYGWAALHDAVREGHIETCRLLIDEYTEVGGDAKDIIAAKDNVNQTTLHHAAIRGQTKTCRMLIDEYVNLSGNIKELVFAKDWKGRTALDFAKLKEYDEIAALLKAMETG